MVVILIIAVVAIILFSAFGVFWSNETAEGTPMTEVISTIDLEFTTNIDNEIARLFTGGADETAYYILVIQMAIQLLYITGMTCWLYMRFLPLQTKPILRMLQL